MNDLNDATQRYSLVAPVEVFRVTVTQGPDAGAVVDSVDGKLSIGTDPAVALRLTDPTVSRFHCELEATDGGLVLRDLGSTNGTLLGPARLHEAHLIGEAELGLGRSRVKVSAGLAAGLIPLSAGAQFGLLLGASARMRAVYAVLARAAPTTVPVLILGESGTGKELAARSVHSQSKRAGEPFEVVDCSALPPTLAESILFGHEKGSFTGATHAAFGAFERAHGGTIFLDELGELPLDLQSKLLRVLGESEVRRVGAQASRKVDVRVIAATNRDLRREVNAGRFRSDLYYRLAVISVQLPPLREHSDDLAFIVPALLERIRVERKLSAIPTVDDALLSLLAGYRWPGNVRELRNWLEQYAVLNVPPSFDDTLTTSGDEALTAGLDAMDLREAKRELIDRFERSYFERLLSETHGSVVETARRANVDRVTVFRTLRRLGIKVGES